MPHELSVLREASVALSATLDFEAVLDRLLEQIARVVPYDAANIMLIEEGRIHVARMRGYEQFGEDVARNVASLSFDIAETANLRRMMETGQPLIIPDTAAYPEWVEVEATSFIRSWAGAPIMIEGQVVAFFSLDKVEPGFYSPDHMEWLEVFAGQAGLALHNARLFEEEQRRAQEAETLREVTAAVASTLDLDQVLEYILVHLERVIPYDSACVFLMEGERMRAVAGRGFPEPEKVLERYYPTDAPLTQEVRRTGRPVIVRDAQADPRYWGWAGTEYVRGWMGVPLLVRSRFIGHVTVDSRRVGTYGEAEARLAQAFANQAAIAIENARLYQEAEQRLQEVTLLSRVTALTTTAEDFTDALEKVCAKLADFFGVPQAAFALLNSERTAARVVAEYRDPGRPSALGLTIPVKDNPSMAYVLEHKVPLAVDDAQSDPRLAPIHAVMRQRGTRSLLVTPILIGDEVVGTLGIDALERREFSQAEISLAQNVTRQVGQALERVRLFEEAQRRTAELEALRETSLNIITQLELPSLLRSIVRRATELLEASGGGLYFYHPEQEELELVVSYNLGDDYTGTRLKVGEGVSGRVVATGEPLIVDDYCVWEGRASIYEEGPFGAVIGVPLHWQERVLGVINVTDLGGRQPFDEKDLHLLEAFAQQAAIAIEKARLFQAEQKARRRAETLQKAAAALSATLELEELLDQVLEELQKVVPYDSASVQLLRDDHLEIIAGRGFPELEKVIGLTFPLAGDNPNQEVIGQKRPVLVPDAYAAYATFKEDPHSHIRSWLGVPLLTKGEVVGMIALDRTEVNAFSEEEADLALTFANHVAIALENARLYEATRRQAVTDGLTGLYNVRYFYEVLENELARSRRYEHRCSLIMLDLDDFKQYNDRYGHLAGDDLLQELAGLIQREIRETDTAVRYGGEEFAVIAPETNGDRGVTLAERLRRAVRDHEFIVRESRRVGRVTISAGVASYPDDAEDAEALVEAADMALLCAKEEKDRVCVAVDAFAGD